ncbi:hypothetical protein [Acinetobacter venetianus]|uniref:hypothetical protein n=1 Tax=Acinetobacter venetianus TaxID=52133 RepID=UPI00241F46D5|nr:hypothetical protein [Acinetobacter venetianus]
MGSWGHGVMGSWGHGVMGRAQSPLPPAQFLNVAFLMHSEKYFKAYVPKGLKLINKIGVMRFDAS